MLKKMQLVYLRKFQSSFQQRLMKKLPILEHMKLLKTAIPVQQHRTDSTPTSQLPIFKKLKTMSKNQFNANSGIFENLSFCLPFKDNPTEKELAAFSDLVKGIFHQGGKIVEFNQNMSEQFAKYVIVDSSQDISTMRSKLSGLVKYQMILNSDFISDSLKSLKRRDITKYIIFDNTQTMHRQATSSEKARKILDQEISQTIIRLTDRQNERQSKRKQHENEKKQIQIIEPKPKTEQEVTYQQLCQKGIDQIQEFEDMIENYDEIESSLVTGKEVPEMIVEGLTELDNTNQTAEKMTEERVKKDQKKEKGQKQQKEIYSKNQQFIDKQKETQEKLKKQQQNESQMPIDPNVPWQPKADRKIVWYAPPKNLASHSFPKNNFICDKLMQLQEYYKRIGDTRCFNYIRAVASIKSHSKEIKHPDDLRQIPGLTQNMISKIKEILSTGQLTKLSRVNFREENRVCKELEKVWGIGCKKAKEFYDIGIRTVDDLRKRPDLITRNMSVGLKYFQEFSKRIPRDKVTRIFQHFKKIFYAQVHSDKLHSVVVVGSYRRGKATCGDIDILICRHDGSVEAKLLQNLIRQLQDKKFITESLSQPRAFDGKNNSAYMGVCFFEGEHHRIDIKHYPVEQYAFALMYFTGSDLFNRQMRMVAHNKGLMLSDHGIKSKERNGQIKIWKGGPVPVLKTQQEIFKFLGQDFCTPAEREI